MTFGKNRLQHKEFNWKSITTQHFRIYYYNRGSSLAHEAAKYCEKNYEKLTNLIGYPSYSKISILVYNSVIDLQQSNVNLDTPNFTGGQTDLIKAKIEIGFNGSHIDFQRNLKKETANLLINQLMYGGSFKEMVQASYLMNLPDWFTGGAALYVAEGASPEMEYVVRDIVKNRKGSINKLSGQEAIIAGQSFWNYLAITYGKGVISNTLNLARIIRNEEEAIQSAVGAPFEVILKGWRNYYGKRINSQDFSYLPSKKDRIKKIKLRPYKHNSIAHNPDSTLIAYGENFNGRIRVRTYNFRTGKKKTVFYGSYRLINQQINYQLPILSWKNTEELSIVYYKNGKAYMVTKNINNGNKDKKTFSAFEDIIAISYSDVSTELAISAVQNGQSDLYVFNYKTNRVRKITKDIYGDFNPSFIPGTRKIIWSSNRQNDTIQYSRYDYDDIKNHYNLFMYDAKNKSTKLTQLTEAEISIKQAVPISQKEIYLLGQRDNLNQIYRLDLNLDTITRVSNFNNSIKSFSISKDQSKLFYTSRRKAKDYIIEQNMFSYLQEYEGLSRKKKVLEKAEKITLHERIKQINIEPFIFKNDSLKQKKYKEQEKKALDKQRRLDALVKFPKQYDPIMGIDYVVSSLVIDQLRGPALLFDFGTSEMFGNHRFSGYAKIFTDLKSNSFGFNYQLLKNRNDFKLSYDRKTIQAVAEDLIVQKYIKNDFEVEFSRPLTPSIRVSGAPAFTTTRFSDLFFKNVEDIVKTYTGLRFNFVLDNTKEEGINMLVGSRGIAKFETYKSLQNSSYDFNKFVMDFRTYKKIYRQMVFAARGSYGNFFGKSQKKFMLGGMDNWFFSGSNTAGQDNPLVIAQGFDNSDLLFNEFATTLRGFEYNELYGPQYILANFELRMPIVKMIYSGPVTSTFLRNLQLIGFYDFGSAWSGVSPFSQNNSLNTQEVGSTQNLDFSATVVNYQNPLISSFGAGFRSMIYGYYIKCDVGWGIKYKEIRKPKLHITLGYDF